MARLFTRQELYELVWASPVTTIAKLHGISDVGLAKRCRRLGVPLPPRGYWARSEVERAAVKPPLPTSLPPPRQRQPAPKSVASETEVRASSPPAKEKITRQQHRYKTRLQRDDKIETFWCKVDSIDRSYVFGVNWRPWEMHEESWTEYDTLTIRSSVRNKTARPYKFVELRVIPAFVDRDTINRELDAIGNVWTERGRKEWLIASASVPADAFYSLCETATRNCFSEIVVDVRNLKRGNGSTSEISLRPRLTDLSDDE